MAVLKISASVGKGCKNKPDDVKKMQMKLNEHRSAGGYKTLKPDGLFGKKTLTAIEIFQKKVLAGKKDGIINPGKATLGGLNCKPGQVGKSDDDPKAKLKPGDRGKAKGDEDDDDDKSDLFDLVVIRKLIRKVPQKDLLFAFASAGKPEDCKLVLKRKGNPKTLGMLVKKESGIPKVTWGIASQADDDRDVLVLDIMGKQLPGMEKKAKKLLKIQKLLPFKKIRLAKGGIEVEDLPEEEEEATAERGEAKPQDEKAEISKKVQETLSKAPAIWQQTRRTIAKNIDQLKSAIRKAFASEGRKAIAEIDQNMKAIDGVLVMLDDRLAKSLAKAGAAKDRRAFDAELKGTMATLKYYANYVASDPLIQHIDSNPFGIKTDLKKTITASLHHVHKTVENASKAA